MKCRQSGATTTHRNLKIQCEKRVGNKIALYLSITDYGQDLEVGVTLLSMAFLATLFLSSSPSHVLNACKKRNKKRDANHCVQRVTTKRYRENLRSPMKRKSDHLKISFSSPSNSFRVNFHQQAHKPNALQKMTATCLSEEKYVCVKEEF